MYFFFLNFLLGEDGMVGGDIFLRRRVEDFWKDGIVVSDVVHDRRDRDCPSR